jgi:hypothetical protein
MCHLHFRPSHARLLALFLSPVYCRFAGAPACAALLHGAAILLSSAAGALAADLPVPRGTTTQLHAQRVVPVWYSAVQYRPGPLKHIQCTQTQQHRWSCGELRSVDQIRLLDGARWSQRCGELQSVNDGVSEEG